MVGTDAAAHDRAVSETTAVAILVGFTVLVTASVGVGVLFAESDDGPPSTEFSFRHYSGNAMLVVEHSSGDPIPAGDIQFSSQGRAITWAGVDDGRNETDIVDQGAAIQLSDNNAWGEPVRSSDTVEVYYLHGDGNSTLLSAWEGA